MRRRFRRRETYCRLTSVYILMGYDIYYSQSLRLRSIVDHLGLIFLDRVYLLLQASRIYKVQLRHALQQAHDNALKIDLATAD